MVQVRIFCHADLQALQDRSGGRMSLELVSLESVSIATDSYALLRNLIERRSCQCPQIDLLSLVAGVAVELDKIKQDLFPLAEAKPGSDGFPEALLLLQNSALRLKRVAKEAQEIVKGCVGSLVEEDELDKVEVVGKLLEKAEVVGSVLVYNVDEVLKGIQEFPWFHSRLPTVLNEIDVVLSTPVYFPDCE